MPRRRRSAARAKLLAAAKDDLGSQIYRYTDKVELRGGLRRELGPLPEMKPCSCHGSTEKPSRVEASGCCCRTVKLLDLCFIIDFKL